MRVLHGIDIFLIERIRRPLTRYGASFTDRIYTPAEIAHCRGRYNSLAGRFAAKEAVAKALGTGLWRKGVEFTDIEILPDENGAPQVKLSGGAEVMYRQRRGLSLSLSISHEAEYVVASCVILAEEPSAAAGTQMKCAMAGSVDSTAVQGAETGVEQDTTVAAGVNLTGKQYADVARQPGDNTIVSHYELGAKANRGMKGDKCGERS